MAQVPQAFKYQAVARDLNGDLLMNQPVSFKISILQGSASGTAVYVETHTSMTNDYGLVNLEIGNGTVVSGSFSAIDWGGDSHYLKVEMDPAGGTLYQAMGTSQLLSVPYALQSGDSPPDDDWTITGNNQYSAVTGNVGIGTSTPGQRLSVVGRVRAANAADETEYAEIYHGGSNALLNWAGDGNLDFRYNNTTLATVSQGDTRLYIPRPNGDYGANKSAVYGFRYGAAGSQYGGSSWAADQVDAALKGYSYFGNNYTAGVAGYSYLDYEKSAAVIGSKYDGSVRGFLAYRDDASKDWAGYFNGDVKVNGTLSGNGSGLINLPADGDWTVSGNNMYSAVTGNVGIGIDTPGQKLTVVGVVRGAANATEVENVEMSHDGTNAYLNWNGAGTLNFRYNSADLMTLVQGGNVGIGTATPGQKLTVVGVVRGAANATESEYLEMSHGGNNAYLNWNGAGKLNFRYNSADLMTLVQGGNLGIGTTSPETDLAVFSDANNQGLTLQTSDNTFNQGIRFRNSGGSYTWHLYRKDAGSNNADLVFANGSSNDITALSDRIVFKNGGKVGIGTSAPAQELSVIGVVRGSNDAAETEYVEMSHGGSHGYINWNGDGNLEFRYSGTALAQVMQTGGFSIAAGNAYMIGGNSMLHNEGTQNIFAGVHAGLNNTGAAGVFIGYNAGASGNSADFNTFLGCKAGAQNTSGSMNTFIGDEAGQQNSTGGSNVCVGAASGDGTTTGSENVFVGIWAGGLNATGNNNTMIGYYAGYTNANQSGNVFIGHNAGRNEAGSNKLYINNDNSASPLIWGDFSTDQVKVNGSLFVTNLPFGDKQNVQWDYATGQFYYDNSSMRYKENIAPLLDDCSKLLDVSPKTYTRPNNPGVYEIGYIAEEFDAAGLNRLVWYDENGRPEGINYDKIVLYTNENVKVLKEENRALKEEIDRLKKEMNERFLRLEKQINP
jgi:hypothetical protein